MYTTFVRRWVISLLILSLSFGLIAFLHPKPALAIDYRSYANTNAAFLNTYYDVNKGLWADRCPGTDIFACWWQSANQLTTVINYMQRGGSNDYTSVIATTYDKNINQFEGQFQNNFLDDTGWWGLAWILAYDKTRDTRYLNTAKVDADHMQAYWDTTTCGGGVWWNYDKGYKNAITIELYIKLNAAYYNRTGNATYLTRAQTGWNWFVGSGMINSQNLVNDGLTTSCQNNGGTVWTYNQGVVLGAAAELHRATGNTAYLDKAQQIANAAMTNLIHTGTGALRENGCESSGDCGGDGPLFKGIFMRNLYELNVRRFNQNNKNFITRNADVIWANDRNVNQFGLFWSGPFTGTDGNKQSSALDAFNAAIQYTNTANLALNRATSASGQCSLMETYSEATDSSTKTKWCSGMVNGSASLVVDIGANNTYSVNQFIVRHAGAGGEDVGFNTRDFKIQGSSDAATWVDLVTVTGNTASTTTHNISNVGFRYYRLWITNPQTSTSFVAARIYEFEVNGTANSTVPTNTPVPPTKTNTPVAVPTNTPVVITNLGLNKPTSASGQCATTETAAKAVDGSTTTKWCGFLSGGSVWMWVDIGANNTYSVNQFVVRHAGAGGESTSYNTRDFKIQGSSDAVTWFDLVTVTGNAASTTTHNISNVGFRYFRLWITVPEQAVFTNAARIYEFEVRGYKN